jgi:hypothetical protein
MRPKTVKTLSFFGIEADDAMWQMLIRRFESQKAIISLPEG